ncbi:MAG: SDR family oxidoreductase [Acidiferrobacterales bacterium]
MQLNDARVLLTGACGGIGRETALRLAAAGARLVLAGRNAGILDTLQAQKAKGGGIASTMTIDISQPGGAQQIQKAAQAALGGIDVLINNAGVLDFGPFAAQSSEAIQRLFAINVIGPVQLTRAVLPNMLDQGRGHIVNIGSVFGSIGFAYMSVYSSSKFAMHGFSQALRRELTGSGITITYVAPRATRTGLNTGAVYRMCEALGMSMDTPDKVAARVVDAIQRDARDVYIGWPESLFVRINALLPGAVDVALRRQHRQVSEFAAQAK